MLYLFPASIRCNEGTSFLCGIFSCIPKSLVCDGFADCPGAIDETNCQKPTSCVEWWEAGYRESGVFQISKVSYTLEYIQSTSFSFPKTRSTLSALCEQSSRD